MIILFHLKLDKFYYIGVMNYLKVTCCDLFFVHIKMSYHWFNKKELLQTANDRYHNCGGTEKSAKYYLENEEVLKENTRNRYRNLSEEKKEAKREEGRNRYEMIKNKKNKLKEYQFFV